MLLECETNKYTQKQKAKHFLRITTTFASLVKKGARTAGFCVGFARCFLFRKLITRPGRCAEKLTGCLYVCEIVPFEMYTLRLTPINAETYIGRQIAFKTRGKYVIKTLLRVSPSGKTIYIDHPDLQNCLEIVSRKVNVILD